MCASRLYDNTDPAIIRPLIEFVCCRPYLGGDGGAVLAGDEAGQEAGGGAAHSYRPQAAVLLRHPPSANSYTFNLAFNSTSGN